mmetsp:Transcript_52161/g.138053  ORF Transcript_52161/g.138053 Transcript_52161/m.138053 type:complete len:1039 (-) Transcript_52161:64-3180(-)
MVAEPSVTRALVAYLGVQPLDLLIVHSAELPLRDGRRLSTGNASDARPVGETPESSGGKNLSYVLNFGITCRGDLATRTAVARRVFQTLVATKANPDRLLQSVMYQMAKDHLNYTDVDVALAGTPSVQKDTIMVQVPAGDRVQCLFADWGSWSDCSVTCSSGFQSRTREIIKGADSRACRSGAVAQQQCSMGACPKPGDIDCRVSDWGRWTRCSPSCGFGMKNRTRTVENPAGPGGTPCPDRLQQIEDCFTHCAIDCKVSGWSDWSDCSATCDKGIRIRKRHVTDRGDGGRKCPALQDTKDCMAGVCPQSCLLTAWTPWTPCSEPCGPDGHSDRIRAVAVAPTGGGYSCHGNLHEIKPCNRKGCNERGVQWGCRITEWTSWSACSRSCGGGAKNRTRMMVGPPSAGGAPCPDTFFDSATCNAYDCPQDCVVGDWGPWTECSKSCEGGRHMRHREIVVKPTGKGHSCPAQIESGVCNDDPCAVDCVLADWSEWTACSASCGPSTRSRRRGVDVWPVGEGEQCDTNLIEKQDCITNECPVDCRLEGWSPWTTCNCKTKQMTRTRDILEASAGNGRPCPPRTGLKETKMCSPGMCEDDFDCEVTPWSQWTVCDAKCGGGERHRVREMTKPASKGGAPCPRLREVDPCNVIPCPTIDCQVTSWHAWSECSKTCDGGVQTRTRSIEVEPSNGGNPCSSYKMKEEQPCSSDPCFLTQANTCEVGDWGPWHGCTASCGGGTETRERRVSPGGPDCPHRHQHKSCAMDPCPGEDVDCKLSSWTRWGSCSKPCGGGRRHRYILVIRDPQGHGAPCPDLDMVDTEDCNVEECKSKPKENRAVVKAALAVDGLDISAQHSLHDALASFIGVDPRDLQFWDLQDGRDSRRLRESNVTQDDRTLSVAFEVVFAGEPEERRAQAEAVVQQLWAIRNETGEDLVAGLEAAAQRDGLDFEPAKLFVRLAAAPEWQEIEFPAILRPGTPLLRYFLGGMTVLAFAFGVLPFLFFSLLGAWYGRGPKSKLPRSHSGASVAGLDGTDEEMLPLSQREE